MKMSNDLKRCDSAVGSLSLTLHVEGVSVGETPDLNQHLLRHKNLAGETQPEVNLARGCSQPKKYAAKKYWAGGMESNRLARFHPLSSRHMNFGPSFHGSYLGVSRPQSRRIDHCRHFHPRVH